MAGPDQPAGGSEVYSPYLIAAVGGGAGGARRVLKNANAFAVFDPLGHAQANGPAAEGLFFEDTRYLSRFVVTIDGRQPRLLSSIVTEENTLLAVDLSNPDLMEDGRLRLPGGTVHLLNSMVLGKVALFVSLEMHNFGMYPARFGLAVDVDSDFVDIFEVRGTPRARRGEMLPAQQHPDGSVLSYRGLDGVTRRTHIRFDPRPAQAAARHVSWDIRLGPGERRTVRLEVCCEHSGARPSRVSRAEAVAEQARWRAERAARVAAISTRNETYEEWLRCSRADLEMLTTETPQGLYPYAGVPWFSTRSEEHTSELQSRGHLVCRLLLEKKKSNRRCQHRLCAQHESGDIPGPGAGNQRFPHWPTAAAGLDRAFFFFMMRRPARSTLFPYTTLFR